jgi:hypothetical protein
MPAGMSLLLVKFLKYQRTKKMNEFESNREYTLMLHDASLISKFCFKK